MRRILFVVLSSVLAATPAAACSFCGGNVSSRNTLREEFAQAKAVVSGTLKNPKVNGDGVSGTTEFHFDKTLKADAILGKQSALVLPKYFPVVGDTPPGYLFFFDSRDGKPDAVFGVPSTPAVTDHLAAVAKLDPKDATKRLAFYFGQLDSADATVSTDAFLEFAKASDLEVIAAKAALDPKRLQKWLADPNTPTERIGVYAMMLGLCGGKEHAATFAAILKRADKTVKENYGGLLAGYALLDPPAAWAELRAVATDGKRPFEERYSALSGAKYLQANRAKESRKEVLDLYRDLVSDTDFSDLAIEDLRRWGWWDLTADVFKRFDAPGQPIIVKKAVVRYAITCPDDVAKTFLAGVRKADPKLVEKVEESLKLLK